MPLQQLHTVRDFIRYGATRFQHAGLCFGHLQDNAIDEAKDLVLHALALPHDLPASYAEARLLDEEKRAILALFERRISERMPAAYLTGTAWFADLAFRCDARALVPRSPISELLVDGLAGLLGDRAIERVLDLCCGSGCIGIAAAVHWPSVHVDLVDLSPDALALAAENRRLHRVEARTELIESDLFGALVGRRYDLILSNPPYVTEGEFADLPPEYEFEPALGLVSGRDGLDHPLRILAAAPAHLQPHGLLILEVGESQHALEACLPGLPCVWLEFRVGAMGVMAIEAEDLLVWHERIEQQLQHRAGTSAA